MQEHIMCYWNSILDVDHNPRRHILDVKTRYVNIPNKSRGYGALSLKAPLVIGASLY